MSDRPNINDYAKALEKINELATERDELLSVLRFVERMANHHGQKPHMTAWETLSWIQHHPGVEAITESYSDGKVPETPNPWKERDELRAEVEQLKADKADKARLDWLERDQIALATLGFKTVRESIDAAMKGAE